MLMMLLVVILLETCVCLSESRRPNSMFPSRTPPTYLSSIESSDPSCPSTSTLDIIEKETRLTRSILNKNYKLRPCKCGGPGWTNVAVLNMSNPSNHCPANFKLSESPVRGCSCKFNGYRSCESMIIPVNGLNYSSVCGRIYAYQKGLSYAFAYSAWYNVNTTIESPYTSGLSLTHGEAGQRKHIWTFSGAVDEAHLLSWPQLSCPCMNSTYTWSYRVPSYVGQSYFCDTGSHYYSPKENRLTNDPLWNGEGCQASSTCCKFNNPPWFCKDLQYHTTDNLELRLFALAFERGEDKLIDLMEIYIK